MREYEIISAVQQAKSLPELIARLRSEGADPLTYDWAMRKYLESRARQKGVPVKGTFELTPLCNFDCRMCYVHLEAEKLRSCQLLTADEWENIMSQAIDSGMMYATLTGGECLTYPDFDRLYLYLHSRAVQVSVLTNGLLLNAERIEFFKKHPPVTVQVTLYGADDDMYERVTGRRVFSSVTENIRNAVEAGIPVRISLTPTVHLTMEENEQVMKLASSFGTDFQVNGGLISPRAETDKSEGFRDMGVEEYIRLFKLERSLKGYLPPEECVADLPPVNTVTDETAPKGLRCGGGRSVFNVTWEGKLVPCNRLIHISSELMKESFASAWQKIHERVMEYRVPAECDKCRFRECSKGCVADHADAPEGHASPEQCKWCKAMAKSGLGKVL